MLKVNILAIFLFVLLFVNKANCFDGFIEQYKELVFYNFSKYNITESNCNDILDQARNYRLLCVNATELSENANKRPKSYYQNYIEKFFNQNKEEVGELTNGFSSGFKIFKDLSSPIIQPAFSPWIVQLKKFIIKHRETIDNFVLSLINDVFGLFDESFKKYPETTDHVVLNKVVHLTQYSIYESDKCMEKFNSLKNHTCFIFSRNYYTLRYNYFMNSFLQE